MQERLFNFSAGPAVLPESVLKQASEEMLNFRGSGLSVMEMSHRSSVYEAIQSKAEMDLRTLLAIPDNYKVLFLQGGASLQFAMVPLNLLRGSKKADFIHTGEWTKKAYQEAQKYGDASIIANGETSRFNVIPQVDASMIRPDADYVYYCSNNTIYGTRHTVIPPVDHTVVVADMSSDILSRPVDVSRHGVIFAGAQKNMGIAGLTVVIIREDLLGYADDKVPTMLNYKIMADGKSLYNTPPAYSIYIAGLVFEWILALGGLEAMEKLNEAKAKLLYDTLDASDFYTTTVNPKDRSLMNVTFRCANEELDKAFVKFCESRGLTNLKGYRSVGGMRASIYNAMPMEGVEKLVACLKEFEADKR